MRRVALLCSAVIAACSGDPADRCGPGTAEIDGLCAPVDAGASCGAGTVLDPATGACVIGGSPCGPGTVLVGGQCQPIAPMPPHVDVEEGPEPNGFEPDAMPAGVLSVPDETDPDGVTIHGCIVPVGGVADWDVYTITATGPALLDLTVAGVGGLEGALTLADRSAVAITSDTAHRRVYLPAAGTYQLALTDARTLLDGIAAGDVGGASCYYATIAQLAPTYAPLTAGVVTGSLGDAPVFYRVPPDQVTAGFIAADIAVPPTPVNLPAPAIPELAMYEAGELRTNTDTTGALEIRAGGFAGGNDVVLVVDDLFDHDPTPTTYTLTITIPPVVPLPRDGSTIVPITEALADQFDENYFSLDVAAAGEIDDLTLATGIPIGGSIVDRDDHPVASFGGDDEELRGYRGPVRFPAPGRYYLAVHTPEAPAGVGFALTSLIATITPQPLALGAPRSGQALDASGTAVYTFDPAGPWASIAAPGALPGTLAIALFDPATAIGRLGALATASTVSVGQTEIDPPDSSPVGSAVLGPVGLVTAELPPAMLLVVTAATPSDPGTFALDAEAVAATQLGTLALDADVTRPGEVANPGAPHRYLMSGPDGQRFQIAATRASGGALALATVTTTEQDVDVADDLGGGATLVGPLSAGQIVAFEVRSLDAVATTYTLDVQVIAPPPCGNDGFQCDDGSCIPDSFLCDGFPDCPSGEDEVGC